MIRSIFCSKDGTCAIDLSPEQLAQILQEPGKLLWVSLEQPTQEEYHTILRDTFHFHPLAIEDCQNTGYQPPKVDDFEEYLFVIAHGVRANGTLDELETVELDLFLGRNYLVTSYNASEMPPVAAIRKRMERDERLLSHGADFLCHAILDHLVDDYMPLLDNMDEELDKLEDKLLERPGTDTLQRILALKHQILTLRRVITPQREVMNRLSRDDLPQIDPRNRIYFRDIYDHLVRIRDLSESLRDVVSGTLDIYLSVTSNRLNEVMKALTIVSTIFLPLTFVAGIYGMNFRYMPEIGWRYGYAMVWGVFILMTTIMLWFFRYRKWL